MQEYKISGLPVVKDDRLVGIITNRDIRFETNDMLMVSDRMTSDNLVTVPVGTSLEKAKDILQEHRIEKLLVVDGDHNLTGLITVKDIQKMKTIQMLVKILMADFVLQLQLVCQVMLLREQMNWQELTLMQLLLIQHMVILKAFWIPFQRLKVITNIFH